MASELDILKHAKNYLDSLSNGVDPLCQQPLLMGRWVRTAPGEQVVRCKCREHRRLYLAVTVEKDEGQWVGKAALYKEAGPIAERYRKAVRKLQETARRKERAKAEKAAG